MQAHVGTAAPVDFNGLVRHYDLRQQSWQADLQVRLLDKGERKRSSHAIATLIRDRLRPLAQDAGAHLAVVEMPPGRRCVRPWSPWFGPSSRRRELTERLTAFFRQADGVADVDNSLHPHPRWHFEVDTEKASRYGVSVPASPRRWTWPWAATAWAPSSRRDLPRSRHRLRGGACPDLPAPGGGVRQLRAPGRDHGTDPAHPHRYPAGTLAAGGRTSRPRR